MTRPPLYDKPMIRQHVMLPRQAIDWYRGLADGNLSLALRRIWEKNRNVPAMFLDTDPLYHADREETK